MVYFMVNGLLMVNGLFMVNILFMVNGLFMVNILFMVNGLFMVNILFMVNGLFYGEWFIDGECIVFQSEIKVNVNRLNSVESVIPYEYSK